MTTFKTTLAVIALLIRGIEPDATCISVSVKPGEKAELLFQMKKDVDLTNKYYIYIRKGTEPNHIVSCYSPEGNCTTLGAPANLVPTLLHGKLALTFGMASWEDGGQYIMDMFVNDINYNSTSCNLTIEDAGSASAGLSAGAIVGIALSIAAFVGGAALVFYVLRRRARRTGSPDASNDEDIALRSKTDDKRGAAVENGEAHVANGAAV